MDRAYWLGWILLTAAGSHAAGPIRVHPANPHYFEFRGKAAVLISTGEHYGSVLNGAFDYGPGVASAGRGVDPVGRGGGAR